MKTGYYIAFFMMAYFFFFASPASADSLIRNLGTDGASGGIALYPSFTTVDSFAVASSGTITRVLLGLRFCQNNVNLSVRINGLEVNFTPPSGTGYREVNFTSYNLRFNSSQAITTIISQRGGAFHNCDIFRNVTNPPPYSYSLYACPIQFDPNKQTFDPVACTANFILPQASTTYCKDNGTLVINETFTVCGTSPVLNPNSQNCRDYSRTREEVCAAGCDPKTAACTPLMMDRLLIVVLVAILVFGFIVYLARRYG